MKKLPIGGGILNSAKKLNETEEEIYNQSKIRLEEVMRELAVEIKSGYGLTLEGELLRY
jgi:imidazolonepropionase